MKSRSIETPESHADIVVGVTDRLWSMYAQDFRCLSFTNKTAKQNLAKNFKRLNPMYILVTAGRK